MHFPRGKDRLRLALPTPTAPSIPYSTPNEYPFFLIPPSSLIECVPTNITWTGGTAPYSLQINLGASSAIIRLFDNIINTYFVWDTDAAAGTAVSLQVVDARTVQVALEPITVGAGPNSSCVQGTITLPPPSPSLRTAPISGVSAYTPYIGPSPSSIPSTVLYWSPPRTSTLTSQTTLAPPSSPAWYTDRQTTQKVSSLNGASSAGLAVGIVSFLTFSVWSWLRFRKRSTRKGTKDAEKQEAAGRGDRLEAAITLWGDDESTTTGTSDDQPEDIAAANPSNETRNDAPAEDQALISTATPPSAPEVSSTQADNTSATPQLTTPRFFSSRRTKRLQTPRLFSTAQSSSDAGTISDTGAARFSSSTVSGSTESTAPPSYRTRQSSVYTPPPPPAYTAANLPPPPGAFRMPGRARRGWLPTSSKLAQGRENAAASAGRGRTVTQDRSEGRMMREERHLGQTVSDSKRAPPGASRGDRAAFSDTADSVSETGATIRSGDHED